MLAEQGRSIQVDYRGENDIHITFPKKKKFKLF